MLSFFLFYFIFFFFCHIFFWKRLRVCVNRSSISCPWLCSGGVPWSTVALVAPLQRCVFFKPRKWALNKFLLHCKNYSEAAIVPQGCIPTANNQIFTSSNMKERSQKNKKIMHFFEFARISCSLRPSLRVENLSGLNSMYHYCTCREGHDEF